MKKLLFALSLFSLFFVTSCKNFFNGNDFLSGLEEAILYNNEPFISVTIQSDVLGTETITPANNTYKNEYKNKSSIKLNVQEKSDYQFTQWEVIPVGAVTFESSIERNTKAEINTQESEIIITPAIFERPSVVSFSPSNLVIQPKNSSISIDFNKKIDFSEEEINTNLSDFKIYMGGLDIHSYFDKPQILENADGNTRIIFNALREKMLPLSSTEATITVTVPENLFYVSENEYKIYSNKPYTYSYTINNQTLDYVDIIFKDVENQASLSIKENKKYYLDEEFSVICQAIPGYHITGWKIVTNYGTETEAEVEPNILITDISDLTTLKVKVLSGSKNTITITPCIEVSKKLDATFTGKNGKVNILESKTYYPKDSFLLTFSENSEYYFTNWSIWDKTAQKYLTEDDIKAIFDFDINSYDQHITVKELEQDYNLELIAETVIRPKIISKSPEISPQGAYRDSTIQIMFNHSINSDSIYFTDEEIKEIEEKNKNVKTKKTTIKDTENNDVEKYYCYYINEGTPEEQKFYKNIEITNYKTGENLNSCFDVPYFESSNVLLIPVVSDENSKPTPGTKILVSISQEVYYSDSSISRSKQNPIKMSNIESWIYEVNDKVDDKNPIFGPIVIKSPSNNDKSFIESSENITILSTDDLKKENFLYQKDYIEILYNRNYYNKNATFNLSISLNDKESGPSSIQAVLHNLTYDKSYTFDLETIINNTDIFYGKYDYSDSKNPKLNTELITLTLPEEFSLEGENTIKFIGKDNKGNTTETEYFHFYYEPFPQIKDNPHGILDGNKLKITYYSTINFSLFKHMLVKYKFLGRDDEYTTTYGDTQNQTIIDLPDPDTYESLDIQIYPVNNFDIKGECCLYNLIKPPLLENLTAKRNPDDPTTKIDIEWTKPTEPIDYISLSYWQGYGITKDTKIYDIDLDKDITQYTISDLDMVGMQTHITIVSHLKDSLISNPQYITYYTAAKPVTNLTATVTSENKIKLSWENSLDNAFVAIYTLTNQGKWSTVKSSLLSGMYIEKDSTTYEYISLLNHQDYVFKVTNYSSSNTTSESEGTFVYFTSIPKFSDVENNLIAVPNSSSPSTKIDLTWISSSYSGMDIYYKLHSESESKWDKIIDVGPLSLYGTASYTVENLTSNTEYDFKLVPYRTNATTGVNWYNNGYIITCTTASE